MSFVIGAIISKNSFKEYYLNSETYIFFLKNMLFNPSYSLPGVFEDVIFKHCVNVSIWTLPIELALHLSLPMVMKFSAFCDKKFEGKLFFSIITFIFVGVYYYQICYGYNHSLVIWGTELWGTIRLIAYFYIGSWLELLSLTRYIDFRHFIILVVMMGFGYDYYKAFLFPVVIVLAVFLFIKDAHSFAPKSELFDASYAMYLWMFPIQQLVVQLFPQMNRNFHCNLMVSVVLTIFVAIVMTKVKKQVMLKLNVILGNKGGYDK